MPVTFHFECDVCAQAFPGEAPTAGSVPASNGVPTPLPEGWAEVDVRLNDRVLPEYMDAVVDSLPDDIGPAGEAHINATAVPFSTFILICPRCREVLAPLNAVIKEHLRKREYVDNAEPAPPTMLRPIK